MPTHLQIRMLVLLTAGLFAAASLAVTASQTTAKPSALKILVIAGEDAVNIIQQKTAVAPIVEVRDRNDQPVSGALVAFTIGKSNAATFAGGVRTLSVATDGAGRATVRGLTPVSNGTYQIKVTATFEGQTATTTINQTNVAITAAAQATGAGVAVGATAGTAAASGGGLSGVAIGAIAAAAGGGALVAVKAASGGNSNPNPTSPTSPTSPTNPTSPAPTTYSGPFSGQLVMTTNSSGSVCSSTTAISGTLTITLTLRGDGTVTGNANTAGTQTEIAFTASPLCRALPGPAPFNTGGPVTGTAGNFGYSFVGGGTGPTPTGGSVTVTNTTTFSGALSGGVITGTMTHTQVSTGQGSPSGGPINGSGTTSFPVTLR